MEGGLEESHGGRNVAVPWRQDWSSALGRGLEQCSGRKMGEPWRQDWSSAVVGMRSLLGALWRGVVGASKDLVS